MNLELAGKKVAITGGSRGIGRAIATRMLAEGASVSICARGQDGVDEALAALGDGAIGQAVDVGDGEALTAWIAWSAEQMGGLDVFVMNASGGGGGTTDEKFDANFQVDLMGLVRGSQAAMAWPLTEGTRSWPVWRATSSAPSPIMRPRSLALETSSKSFFMPERSP